MPTDLTSGEKRPVEVIGGAVKIMGIAMSEEQENANRPEDQGKYPTAVAGPRARWASSSQRLAWM